MLKQICSALLKMFTTETHQSLITKRQIKEREGTAKSILHSNIIFLKQVPYLIWKVNKNYNTRKKNSKKPPNNHPNYLKKKVLNSFWITKLLKASSFPFNFRFRQLGGL